MVDGTRTLDRLVCESIPAGISWVLFLYRTGLAYQGQTAWSVLQPGGSAYRQGDNHATFPDSSAAGQE
jgi:hypothetical protein